MNVSTSLTLMQVSTLLKLVQVSMLLRARADERKVFRLDGYVDPKNRSPYMFKLVQVSTRRVGA